MVGYEEVEAEAWLPRADEGLMVEQDRSPGQTLTLKMTNSTGLVEVVWVLALKVLHLKKPLFMEKATQKILQR